MANDKQILSTAVAKANSRVAEDKTVKEVKTKVHVVDVIRHGEKIILPPGMELSVAIDTLKLKMQAEEQVIDIAEKIPAFIWEGALAFMKAMELKFGIVNAETVKEESIFGVKITPPQMIAIETGVGEVTHVPWGRFTIPGIEGWLETGYTIDSDRLFFVAKAHVKRKHEDQIKELAQIASAMVKTQSIYRGKAVKLRFRDDDGEIDYMMMPKFVDLAGVKEHELVFSEELMASVATNVFTPIIKSEECRKLKIPLKRGILLSGTYGTGKTLVAHVTAKKSVDNGWTFLYCEKASELKDMVKFAMQYQPAVIFCEDIDRVMVGERSVSMDDILNIIDGIESKSTELMVILTTNHVKQINKAMLRPGHLDAVINVTPPDAKACESLVKLFGRGLIPDNADLSTVGKKLSGQIPAVIRECVERAKLSAIKMQQDGQPICLTPEVLVDAITSMKNQLDLLNSKQSPQDERKKLAESIGETLLENVTPMTVEAADKIEI